MKKMLKDDLVRFFLFITLSVLATIFVSMIEKNESLSIITKALIYIIPILNFLKNHDNIKDYGVKKTIIKEIIMLGLTVIACVLIEFFNSYMFTGSWYRSGRLVDIFVLITEVLSLMVLLFIGKFSRKIGFILLLIVGTITFVLVSKAPEYSYMIYIFYVIIDLILIFELIILIRHYIMAENN